MTTPGLFNDPSPLPVQGALPPLVGLLQHLPDALLIVDQDGCIQFVNPAAEKLAERTPDQLLGQNLFVVFPRLVHSPFEAQYRRAITQQTPLHFEETSPYSQRRFAVSLYPHAGGLAIYYRNTAPPETHDQPPPPAPDAENKALRDSETRFRALFEANTIGIMLVNGEQVIDANDVLLELLGYTRPEIETKPLLWPDLTPSEYREQDQKAIDRLLATRRCTPYEKEYFRKDGTRVPVLVGAAIMETDPPLGACFVVDLTVQKQAQALAHRSEERLRRNLETSRNQLSLITDTAPVLIAYIDADQIFQFNNRHYARWFNRPIEQITGHSVRALLGDDAYFGVQEYIQAALSGNSVTFERLMVYEPGHSRFIHADFVPDCDSEGNVRGFVSVVSDITPLKRAQEEQEKYADQIHALNLRLRRAMTETHHRVKNNLQIIAALVGMQMLTGGDTIPKEDLERIGLHVRSLATIHDMLTAEARIDGEGNSLSARQILSKLLFMLSDAFANHRLEYILDDIRLSARQSASLGIIVNELVSNALKYGNELVEVTLRQEDKQAILQIGDDGPGFPPGFDHGQSAHTGLELVENLSRWDLNGRTLYENGPQGGARITITFPLPEEQPPLHLP